MKLVARKCPIDELEECCRKGCSCPGIFCTFFTYEGAIGICLDCFEDWMEG